MQTPFDNIRSPAVAGTPKFERVRQAARSQSSRTRHPTSNEQSWAKDIADVIGTVLFLAAFVKLFWVLSDPLGSIGGFILLLMVASAIFGIAHRGEEN